MSEILASYLNGNNTVTIYTDGTKERIIVDSFNKFPESVDCKITNWCDAGCSYWIRTMVYAQRKQTTGVNNGYS